MVWQLALTVALAIGFAAGRLIGFEVWAARRSARRRSAAPTIAKSGEENADLASGS